MTLRASKIVKMILILSSLTRRAPNVHSLLSPRVVLTPIVNIRNYHGRIHASTMSLRIFDTVLTCSLNEKRRQLSSSTNTGRHQTFHRSHRKSKFKQGLNILAQSEQNTGAEPDKDFNLFEGIPQQQIEFRTGLPIIVEVLKFGPLGASVAVIGKGSHDASTMKLSDSSNPLATGLIYQNEIQFYRQSRRNVDVVRGEILPAYVERVRDDGKIDVSLRVIGGRAKVDKWSGDVLKRLEQFGELPVGNKSTPVEIAREFPGMSKSDFKKCIGALFERKLVFPFAYTITPYEVGLTIAATERDTEDVKNDGPGHGTNNNYNSGSNSTNWNNNGSNNSTNR